MPFDIGKALEIDGISFGEGFAGLFAGTDDPTISFLGGTNLIPVGSIYIRVASGSSDLFQRIGSGNYDWTSIKTAASGSSIGISDDTSTVLPATELNFGDNLNVSSEGGGRYRIDAVGGLASILVGQDSTLIEAVEVMFGDGFTVIDLGNGVVQIDTAVTPGGSLWTYDLNGDVMPKSLSELVQSEQLWELDINGDLTPKT